jgi:hypothetical protein
MFFSKQGFPWFYRYDADIGRNVAGQGLQIMYRFEKSRGGL